MDSKHIYCCCACCRADFDDSMSGTTAICVLLRGRSLLVANVGDSRAVLAERVDGGVVARDLSLDQTPYREDERDRVKARGARVATLDQIEGVKVRSEVLGGWAGGEKQVFGPIMALYFGRM